jgi:hypothetical protein
MSKQFVTTKNMDDAALHVQHVKEIRALIESGNVKPQIWYDAFRASQGRDTTLDDDELVDVIADQSDEDEDFETPAQYVRLMLEAEAAQDAEGEAEDDAEDAAEDGNQQQTPADQPNKKDISISGATVSGTVSPRIIEAKALAIAAKMQADNPIAKAFREHIVKVLDAPETTKMGAVLALLNMRKLYPKTSNMNPLLLLPIPYSVEKTDNKNPIKAEVIDGQANPDVYKRFEKNEKGKRVKRQASFYGNLADDMMEGTIEDFAKRIAAIKKAKEKKWDQSMWSQLYAGWKHHELESELSRVQSRRTRLITLLRQSVELERQFLDVETRLPLVVATFVSSPADVKDKDKDIGFGKGRILRNTMKPIKIYEKADQSEFDVYSVSTFLSLNVTKAVDAGGEIGDVYAAFGEGAEEGDDEETKFDIVAMEAIAPDFLNFVEKHKAAIYKRLNTKDPEESNDLLLTLEKLWDELGDIKTKYELRLDKLHQSINDAAAKATGTQG